MSLLKNIGWTKSASSMNSYLSMEVSFAEMMKDISLSDFYDKIVEILATKFVEEHGAEVLSRIHEKTVDAKVIAKVVANLRKELSNEKK